MPLITQFDVPYISSVYTPYRSGIWLINLTGVTEYIYGIAGKYDGIPQITPESIGSMRLGLNYLDEVFSEEDCFRNPGTYFYFAETFKIIVNIPDASGIVGYQTPFGKRLEIGIIESYIDHVDYSRADEAYYNNVYCHPRASSGDTSSKRDKLFYGINSYASLDVDIDNHDGMLDDKSYLGSVARQYSVKAGGDLTADTLIKYGFVTKYNRSNQKASLTIGDRRKTLDVNIDLGRITKDYYPHLDDETADESKIIPIAIGTIKDYQPTCVDKKNTTSGVASYILCKTYGGYHLSSVSSVTYETTEDDETGTKTIGASTDGTVATGYLVDYTNGLLLINRATVCDGDSWTDIKVSYDGWMNPDGSHFCGVDLIKLGLSVFGKIDDEDWNFDQESFVQGRPKSIAQGRQYSLLIDGEMTVTSFLNKVCLSSDTVEACKGDGRFAVKVIESEAAGTIKAEISADQLINRTDNISSTLSEVISTVKVNYGYAGNGDNAKTLTDDSAETEIEELYHITKDETFDTCLADEASAQVKATALLSAARAITPSSDFTLWATPDLERLDVVDTIVAPTNRAGSRALYNITQIKKSSSKNRLSFTANKIADIKYDPGYSQGHALGRSALGVTALSTTIYSY